MVKIFKQNLFVIAGITALCMLSGCKDTSSQATLLSDIFSGSGKVPTPTQAAKQAFNTNDPDLRRHAVVLFSAAPFGGDKPYVKMYRLLITDPDPTVRAACAKALGKHGTSKDALKIAKLLDDDSAFARWQAARALQKLHNPKVVSALIDTLKSDKDTDVRMACAKALGQYPQRRVFSTLVGSLADNDYSVVNQAANSLTTLTGYTKAKDDGADWLRWENKHEGDIFQKQKQYTYRPYYAPPGFFRKLEFWNPTKPPKPKTVKTGQSATSSSQQ